MSALGAKLRAMVIVLAVSAVPAASAAPLNIVGTGDGLDMLRAVIAAYLQSRPGEEVAAPASIGSGGGVAAVVADRERMGRVARKLSDAETAQGIAYLPLARIPSAIIANPSVNVANLSNEQLSGLFSGRFANWQDVGGGDLKVRVVRREDGDSTLGALRAMMPGWKDLALTPLSKQVVTTQEAIETVSKVEGSIGFAPYSNGLEPIVKVLKIDGRLPNDNTYPSAVTLGLIYKRDTTDAGVKSFLEFAKSKEARGIVAGYGAIPLSE